MKKQKAVTLVSLIIYIIVMMIVLGVMSAIISNFYENTSIVQANIQEIIKFNKFNSYFLKEVKAKNNKVDNISLNYILFSSGNSFIISNNEIYYNNIKICDGVKSVEFTLIKDEEDTVDIEEDYSIINVTISFENFSRSINYKLEDIY